MLRLTCLMFVQAFKAYCCSGKDGSAPVLRPLESEHVEANLLEFFQAVSKLVTTMRQHNEWGNGGVLVTGQPSVCAVGAYDVTYCCACSTRADIPWHLEAGPCDRRS